MSKDLTSTLIFKSCILQQESLGCATAVDSLFGRTPGTVQRGVMMFAA